MFRSGHMMQTLDEKVSGIKEELHTSLVKRRGHRGKWFHYGLKYLKFIPGNRIHGELLESYYTFMRYIDDIVDGDHPYRNVPYDLRPDFVEQRIHFARELQKPKDESDLLLLHSFELAHRAGIDLSEETQDILKSLHFDAKRVGRHLILPSSELQEHFHRLDIHGTIRGALKLFKEDSSTYPALEDLGFAARVYYDLRDHESDLSAGYVNISREACEYYGIVGFDKRSSGVQRWFIDQARLGLAHLERHRDTMARMNYRFLTSLTLLLAYEQPARKFFQQCNLYS